MIQQNKHMLLQKKMNNLVNAYQDVQTQWIDNEDALIVKHFIESKNNVPVEGFYKYILVLEGGFSMECFSACADLLDYAKYCKDRKSVVRIINNHCEEKNVIEQ